MVGIVAAAPAGSTLSPIQIQRLRCQLLKCSQQCWLSICPSHRGSLGAVSALSCGFPSAFSLESFTDLYRQPLDTYTVNLPDNLPPTFRGKAVRFSYELVVGLCRAGQSSMGLTPTNSEHSHSGSANVSKLMKVPIRMYNNVVGQCFSLYRRLFILSGEPL